MRPRQVVAALQRARLIGRADIERHMRASDSFMEEGVCPAGIRPTPRHWRLWRAAIPFLFNMKPGSPFAGLSYRLARSERKAGARTRPLRPRLAALVRLASDQPICRKARPRQRQSDPCFLRTYQQNSDVIRFIPRSFCSSDLFSRRLSENYK